MCFHCKELRETKWSAVYVRKSRAVFKWKLTSNDGYKKVLLLLLIAEFTKEHQKNSNCVVKKSQQSSSGFSKDKEA